MGRIKRYMAQAFLFALFCFLIGVKPAFAAPSENLEEPLLNADVIFSLVNIYRKTISLPPFQKEEKICSLAKERAPEIYNEIFINGPMHKGLYNRNLPYWITENIIYMRNEQAALNWWLNSRIHRHAIENNYQYSCVACQGQACSELFTNYDPK